MAMKAKCILIYCGFLILTGCASKKVVQERGWVGGSYAVAVRGSKFWQWGGHDVVQGLPKTVREKQGAAILITDAPSKSPIVRGGLRAGDLIVEINGTPMLNLKQFRKAIDASAPGSLLKLTIFREGKLIEETVTVGTERFRDEHAFTVGIGLGTTLKIDVVPNPDFSLVALGYEHKEDRLNLSDPKLAYVRSLEVGSTNSTATGYHSGEGWNSWLAIFSVSGHKVILSQE